MTCVIKPASKRPVIHVSKHAHLQWRGLQEVISDFLSLMDVRTRLQTDWPISHDVCRASANPLPLCIIDKGGAPPAVVWLAPALPPAKEAGHGKVRNVRPRRRGEGPSASN